MNRRSFLSTLFGFAASVCVGMQSDFRIAPARFGLLPALPISAHTAHLLSETLRDCAAFREIALGKKLN